MVTIRDIASLAGVSPATVSRYLNGHITVREETRFRIDDAVRRLNYKPNYLARSLVRKETQTIGVIIPDILNPYYSGLARGVEDEAQGTGWSVVLCNSDNKMEKELSYLEMLEYKQVDGIVLVSSAQSGQHLQKLLDRKVALVLASRQVDGVQVDSVIVANTKGAYEATRHLIRLGHTRIAAITGNLHIRTGRERLEGYRQAMSEAGIPVDERLIATVGDFQREGGYSAMMRLLRRSPWPTAVFAANDLIAVGAMAAIDARGGVVPGDVAVVGFDGIPLGELVRPRLTTMSVQPRTIGKMACRLLLDRVARGKNPPPRRVMVDARLEIRDSCGARPANSRAGGQDGSRADAERPRV